MQHTISVIFPSSYQNLSKLVEIWQSSNKNKNAPFLDTVYLYLYWVRYQNGSRSWQLKKRQNECGRRVEENQQLRWAAWQNDASWRMRSRPMKHLRWSGIVLRHCRDHLLYPKCGVIKLDWQGQTFWQRTSSCPLQHLRLPFLRFCWSYSLEFTA